MRGAPVARPRVRIRAAFLHGLASEENIGKLSYWLILAAVLISTGNAVIRYSLNMSSNAWLEIQWYDRESVVS